MISATLLSRVLGFVRETVIAYYFGATAATEEKRDDLRRTFADSLRMLWLVIIPAAVGLVVLREPIVRLLFERGTFDAAAT